MSLKNGESPVRVQRRRTKGYRLPPNTVYVGRGTKWGNPWKITPHDDGQATVADPVSATTFASMHAAAMHAVASFRWQLLNHPNVLGFTEAEVRTELAGKNLACWCPLTDAQGNHVTCHADVLLEIANEEGS